MRKENGSRYIYPNTIQPGWTELKVGVLMPFHQQGNNYTRELTLTGTSAIRMAAEEINAKQLIPGAYITLVERDSFPKQVQGQEGITQAVFAAVSLIQEGVIGVIGDISSSWTSLSALMTSTLRIPQCSFSAAATSLSDKTQYSYFFRTIPTKLLYADAAISFLVSQGWPTLGILYTNDDSGQQCKYNIYMTLSESLVMKTKAKGIHVKAYQKFYEDGPQSDIEGPINTLMNDGIKIVFVAAEGDAQLAALTVAANLGHINNSTVWLTTGTIAKSLASATRQFNDALQKRKDIEQQQQQRNQQGSNDPSSSSSSSSTAYNITADASNAILYAAATTKNLEPIDFEKTYAGGVFSFESTLDLKGYPPYESFLDRWSQLDPSM
ncbi:periplasmic binding protein-like I [Lichtheimia hyalospora FSU 10163]|nr:periplasmic binding protein-like I [Lichtheimia hyalospora FSU 10163]